MRWQTICFDLDNTLFSHEEAFEKAIYFCFETLFKKYNYENKINLDDMFKVFKKNCDLYWDEYERGIITPKEYRRRRFLSTVSHYQMPFNYNDADEFHEHYYSIVDDFSEPYPKLYSLITTLVEASIKIGIITNGTVDTQYNKIKKLQLNNWIREDCIFISEEVNVAKPNREIFDLAKQKLHSKSDYLFIGDSWEHDVVGSIEAGWDSIFLNTRNEERKTSHKPIEICSTLEEVAEIIYRENNLKG
jgi:5'-nucleotidase